MKKFQNSPDYLKKLIRWSETRRNSLRNYLEKTLNKKIIKTLSNAEIAERYEKYATLYRSLHFRNTPPWWVGGEGVDREIKTYFERNSLSPELIPLLTEALEFTAENQAEELSLLRIAIELSKRGMKKITKETLPPDMKEKVGRHLKAYSSISHGYTNGIVWALDDLVSRINAFLSSKVKPEEVKVERDQNRKSRIAKRDKIMERLRLPEKTRNMIIALRQLQYLQDLKKTTQTRSHPLLHLVVYEELGKRLDVPRDFLHFLSHMEIRDALLNPDSFFGLRAKVEKRMKYAVLIMKDGRYHWLYKKEAQAFLRENGIEGNAKYDGKIIKGTSACSGKARGAVKICRTSKEVGKIRAGDILVAPMTTPDFAPAMKKAGAIVTDEGGITSHAAIVSRELKKPCVIGTKIATKVLKDGDVVEVNANEGIVKILKRADVLGT